MQKWEEENHHRLELASTKAERLKSKYLYKIFLISIKYFPILNILIEIIYSISAYFNINVNILTYFGGSSIMYLILLWIASEVFRFCYLYRLQLTSIIGVNLIAWYDTEFGISISDIQILRIYLIILLIGLVAFIKFMVNNHVTNNKK